MRVPHYLTLTRSGRYVFRIVVPLALRAATGRVAFTRTITAASRADAAARAHVLRARYALVFRALGGVMAGKEDKDKRALVERAEAMLRDTYELPDVLWVAAPADQAPTPAQGGDLAAMVKELVGALKASGGAAPEKPAPNGPPLEDALTLYWQTEGRELAPDTIDARQRAARSLVECDGIGKRRKVSEISRPQAVAWLDGLLTGRKMAKKTAHGYATHIRQIWHWLERRGEVAGNPFAGLITIPQRPSGNADARGTGGRRSTSTSSKRSLTRRTCAGREKSTSGLAR